MKNEYGISQYDCTVIGGGVAGLNAAVKIADSGLRVLLLEKDFYTGGKTASYCCQATDRCLKCGACNVTKLNRKTLKHPLIEVITQVTLKQIEKANNIFNISYSRSRLYVDPNRCSGCGQCVEVCPVSGSGAIRPILTDFSQKLYAIDKATCLNGNGKECNLCEVACKFKAITNIDQEAEEMVYSKTIVLATGFEPLNLTDKKIYKYGRSLNVISASDFSERLFNGKVNRPSDNRIPNSIAFIHCVGSRNRKTQINCSRVCCGYIARMALRIKKNYPDIQISQFYIDLQPFGRGSKKIYEELFKSGIKQVRSIPAEAEIIAADDVALSFENRETGQIEKDIFSLVVLANGIPSSCVSSQVADSLKIKLDKDGFIRTENSDDAIFVTGSALIPMSIDESISNSQAIATKVIKFVHGESILATQVQGPLKPSVHEVYKQ